MITTANTPWWPKILSKLIMQSQYTDGLTKTIDHDHDCDQATTDQEYYDQNHNGDDDDDFSRLQQPNKENWRKWK